MNKFLLSLSGWAIVMYLFASCSSASHSGSVRKNDLIGQWEVVSTAIEGIPNSYDLRITSFDDAPLGCFKNSRWDLPNNGYGNYHLVQQSCDNGERQIIWSVQNSEGKSYLNFKKMDGLQRNEAKNVSEGYSLEVKASNRDHFTASSPVMFEGKTIHIVYDFERRK